MKTLPIQVALHPDRANLILLAPGWMIPEEVGHNCDAEGCPSAGMHVVGRTDVHPDWWGHLRNLPEHNSPKAETTLDRVVSLLRRFYVAYQKPEWEEGECAEEVSMEVHGVLDDLAWWQGIGEAVTPGPYPARPKSLPTAPEIPSDSTADNGTGDRGVDGKGNVIPRGDLAAGDWHAYLRLLAGCPDCIAGRYERVLLDEDGVFCSVSGRPGRWGHAVDEYHWYCADAGAIAENKRLAAEVERLRGENEQVRRDADRMAAGICLAIDTKQLDSRSHAADAVLDYCDSKPWSRDKCWRVLNGAPAAPVPDVAGEE